MKNRFFRILTGIIAACILTSSAFAEAPENVGGFAVESERALPAKTPYDKNSVDILWSTPEAATVGAPIADGEYVFLPTNNLVKKLREADGSTVAAAAFDEKISEEFCGAIAGGILVQPTRSSIYVVNTEDMSVKCSRQFGEIATNAAVIDNFAYFGVKTESAYKFICADIENGLETVWEYSSKNPLTSPALFGEHVVFGAGESLAVCRFDNGEFSENPAGEQITNVFAGKYAVFMTCADGSLRKLRLEADGTAEEGSLEICSIGGELTAPAEFGNRVYVGSTEGFFILDGLNMEIIKAFPELKGASSPIICYGNGQRAYTAAPHYDSGRDIWYLYGVLDTEEQQTAIEIAKIIDYTNGKLAVSESGTMYFRDAKGQLWAIAASKTSVFMMILKVVLTLAIIAMAVIIIWSLAKKRTAKKPKF